jgi:hypothetical protein
LQHCAFGLPSPDAFIGLMNFALTVETGENAFTSEFYRWAQGLGT